MKGLKRNICIVLGNENGGPNIEELVGIAVSLSVGAGLFLFGNSVHDWFDKNASKTVSEISLPPNSAWDL